MSRPIATLAAVALLLASAPLQAQTEITQTVTLTSTQNVAYVPFTVSTGELFEIRSFGGVNGVMDPYLRLFSGYATTGAGLGTSLGSNDDISFPTNVNSQFFANLVAGDYTVAASLFNFSVADARDGFNNAIGTTSNCLNAGGTCQYDVRIAVVTPEPASLLLLGTGLLGIAGFARKRIATQA